MSLNTFKITIQKKFNEQENKLEVVGKITGTKEAIETINKALQYFNSTRSIDNNREYKIWVFLYRLFLKHKNFYKYFNIVSEEKLYRYHGNDTEFGNVCSGFEKFQQEILGINRWIDADEKLLQKIAEICTQHINNLLQEYTKIKTINVKTEVSASFIISSEEEKTEDFSKVIPKLNNAVIITNDGAYTITVTKASSEIRSFSDLANSISESLHTIYKAQLEAQVNALKFRIQELEREKEELKQKMFIEGLKLAEKLKEKGWALESGYLVLKKKVVAEKIKKDNIILEIPETQRVFYVENIQISLKETVDRAFCDSSYHPNVDSESNKLCLGDLQNKQLLEVVEGIEEVFKTINLDSAYDQEATEEATEMFNELKEREEHTEEVWDLETWS